MKSALLVVDVQNDFCPGGALAVPKGDAIIPGINALMDRFETVVLTQDWHPPGHCGFASSHAGRTPGDWVEMPYGPQILWPDHCVQETQGAGFHSGLRRDRVSLVQRKGWRLEIDSYSAFRENDRITPTGLEDWLGEQGIGAITLVGLATDFCVADSAVDAAGLGFEVEVILDLCRGIDLDGSLAASLARMQAAGVRLSQAR